MAIDVLQDKIRKLKNPSMVDFGIRPEHIPPHLLTQEASYMDAYGRFCEELLFALKGVVPAVRFDFASFALLGPEGLLKLRKLLGKAKELGFYVVLDGPELLSPWSADRTAEAIFSADSQYPCDGLVISAYIGSDAVKPFLSRCKDGKDLFVIVRSPNKSAAELQDLLTGSRLAHNATADLVSRSGESLLGKCGYSCIGALASAGVPSVLKNLRERYSRMFLLVDGLDYPSGNAKNCSNAFDRFGHGAVCCAGPSVTAAWCNAESDGTDYITQAVQAAERMKKNIMRYITIL